MYKIGDKVKVLSDVWNLSCPQGTSTEVLKEIDNEGFITVRGNRTKEDEVWFFPEELELIESNQEYIEMRGVDKKCECGSNLTGYCACPSEPAKRTFESGAVRDSNEGKSRPDLISPYFTNRLGHRLAFGMTKYGERNWEKGIPDAAFLESLERHLVAYKMGKKDEDHAGAIAFNIMGIIHNEEIRLLAQEDKPTVQA